MAKYSYDFKKRVVEDYINNKGGYRYLANKYQLPDYRIVRQWVANYKAFGDKSLRRSRKQNKYSFEKKLWYCQTFFANS